MKMINGTHTHYNGFQYLSVMVCCLHKHSWMNRKVFSGNLAFSLLFKRLHHEMQVLEGFEGSH